MCDLAILTSAKEICIYEKVLALIVFFWIIKYLVLIFL